MATENISQVELAQRINRTDRQIRKLHDHGIPRNPDGTYPWPEVHDWFVRFKQEEQARRAGTKEPSELDKARAQKERALARLREIELEEKLGNLITLDFHLEKLDVILTVVRKRLENLPSMASRFVGLDTPVQAQTQLEKVRDEMLEMLRRAAEELRRDGDTPVSDSELGA